MDKELIKQEFIAEAESLINLYNSKSESESGTTINDYKRHLENTKDFTLKLNPLVNEILKKHNVVFANDDEKNNFTEFITPTVNDLVKRFLSK